LDDQPRDAGLTVDKVHGEKAKGYFVEWQQMFETEMTRRDESTVAVVDANRKPKTASYNTSMFFDQVPSATTGNQKLLVFGGADVSAKASKQGRYMTIRERSRIIGFPAESFDMMASVLSPAQITRALGNTILVNVAGAILRDLWKYTDEVRSATETITRELLPVLPSPLESPDDRSKTRKRKSDEVRTTQSGTKRLVLFSYTPRHGR
jgi:hypothetical protein